MRWMLSTSLVRAAAVVAALAAAVLVAGPQALRADEVDDAVAKLKELEKAGDVKGLKAKIQEVRDRNDPKIAAALRDLARSKDDEVAVAAIKAGAKNKDPKLLEWLKPKLDDKDYYKLDPGKGRPTVFMAILEAVGEYRERSVLKGLEDIVNKFMALNSDYTTRGIKSYGKVREPAVVDQLLKWLESADSRGGGQGGKNETTEQRTCKDAASKAIVETLNEMTGQENADAKTWKLWWDSNRKTFKFPDPDKKVAEVDVTNLPSWTDPAYGYTITKPTGSGGWTYKLETWCRISLYKKDDTALEEGRVNWGIHNTTTLTPKDLKSFAQWWVDVGYPKEFSEFSETGKPKIEEKKFAGRQWLVITAKGMAKDNLKAWGSMERRVYVTPCDYMKAPHLLLWAQTTSRNGMDEANKTRLFGSVESVVIKAQK